MSGASSSWSRRRLDSATNSATHALRARRHRDDNEHHRPGGFASAIGHQPDGHAGGDRDGGPRLGRPVGSARLLRRRQHPSAAVTPIPVSPTGQSVTVSCQTTFAASAAQLSAVFTPNPGTAVAGSSSPVDVLSVGRDSTSTSLYVPSGIVCRRAHHVHRAGLTSGGASRPARAHGDASSSSTAASRSQDASRSRSVLRAPRARSRTSRPGSRAITARYEGDGNFDPSASSAADRPRSPLAHASPRRCGGPSPSRQPIRRVLALDGAGSHARPGGGELPREGMSVRPPCARGRHPRTICTRKVHGRCRQSRTTVGTVDLAPGFGNHHLAVGTQITVAITRARLDREVLHRSRSRHAKHRGSRSAAWRRGRLDRAKRVSVSRAAPA